MAALTLETYRIALRGLLAKDSKRGFKIHLCIYVIMNSFIIPFNLLTSPETLWFLGALIGWGSGVIAHYITGVVIIEKKLLGMERQAEALAQEQVGATPYVEAGTEPHPDSREVSTI
jgi:hypothetical protein